MKLYVANGAPNARKVRAVVNHLGLDVDLVFLDFFKGQLKSEAYLRLNPTGRIPTLEDEGLVLWESNAINRYLCAKCPGNTLYPADPRLQADIDRWLSWELAHYNQQIGILGFQTVLKPNFMGHGPDDHLVAWSVRNLRQHADILERHLEGRRFVVGDDITIADYALAHIESLKEAIPFDWAPYRNINAYYDRMRAVPYWAETAAAPDQVGRVPPGVKPFAA